MRFDKMITRWTTASAIGLAMSLTACFDGRESGAPAPTGAKADAAEAFTQEVLTLKKKQGIDYDGALQRLQAKHGIAPAMDADKAPQDGSRPAGLSKSAANGTYTVAKVHMEVKYLAQYDQIDWTTSGGASGVDPVMVLYRYGNQSTDFVASGYVDRNAQHLNDIYAFNDDHSGTLHSRIQYTVPPGGGGFFAIMVFVYSNASTKGNVTLTRKHLNSNTGNWSQSSSWIPVTGHIERYSGPHNPHGYLYANATSGVGTDPWAFWFDFHEMRGGDNDNTNGGLNSWAALTGGTAPGSTDTHTLNCMVFTGYKSGGTSTWQHGQ